MQESEVINSTEKLVTVYIPTYNRPLLLERAIKSVIKQTYPAIEIIVVDDGSTDNTAEVLKLLMAKYSNLRVFSHQRSKGACAARNLAIENAKGFYITGLDDDDEFLPHRVSDFVENYSADYSFLCATSIQVNKTEQLKRLERNSFISWAEIKNKNHVGNQIFIERSRLTVNLRFSEEMPAWQDYELWFRLIKEYGTAYRVDNHSYKVDVGSAVDRISTSSKAYLGFCKFIERHKEDLTTAQINNQAVNDLYNRRVSLSIFETVGSIRSFYTAKRLFLLFLLIRLPKVYQLLLLITDAIYRLVIPRVKKNDS